VVRLHGCLSVRQAHGPRVLLHGGVMDGMRVPSEHVTAYGPYGPPVGRLTDCPRDGTKDGLSIGMVYAIPLAIGDVRWRGDARRAENPIVMSSRRCERLPPARISRDPAGRSEATSSRRLRVHVVQHQSDRLDAW
jgi:hypothetical protein